MAFDPESRCRCTHTVFYHRTSDGPCLQCACPEFRAAVVPIGYKRT